MKLYGLLGYTKSPSLTFKEISTSHKNFSLNFVIGIYIFIYSKNNVIL